MESFERVFSGVALPDLILSDLDMKVLLKYMERDMGVVVVDGKVAIKVRDQPPRANLGFYRLSSLWNGDFESRTIGAVDSGLLELRTAVQNQNAQIESVQGRIKEYVHTLLVTRISRSPFLLA